MFLELRIENYALIDQASLTFGPGLNILSGETGAGKSIIIGTINLLLGERASVEHIRQGAASACVEGLIDSRAIKNEALKDLFNKAGLEAGEELIVAREIYSNGRSVARVNGRSVPVSFLKELGAHLVDLHGQHQHQSLLKTANHLELLDSFGGAELLAIRNKLAALFEQKAALKKRLQSFGETGAERERRIDICNFQLQEIRSADLQPGEDEELKVKEKILGNAEKLCRLTETCYSDLYRGGQGPGPAEAVIDRLRRSLALLNEAAAVDSDLAGLCEVLASATEQTAEAGHELRAYQLKLEFEPEELTMLQERLNLITGLKKKYGPALADVLKFAASLELEKEHLLNSEQLAQNIEKELSALDEAIKKEALALHYLRKKTALTLEEQTMAVLNELALAGAAFKIAISEKETAGPAGKDEVEFLFSANRGEEVKPLVKIISGGEVARVMLALKTVLVRQDQVSTLVFDEVDAGIGGATIQAVAEKLAGLAQNHQVMCVTHSPQIAAMADHHFYLYKEASNKRTVTRARLLEGAAINNELARMLDGALIDEVSLKHAANLLERAGNFKSALK